MKTSSYLETFEKAEALSLARVMEAEWRSKEITRCRRSAKINLIVTCGLAILFLTAFWREYIRGGDSTSHSTIFWMMALMWFLTSAQKANQRVVLLSLIDNVICSENRQERNEHATL